MLEITSPVDSYSSIPYNGCSVSLVMGFFAANSLRMHSSPSLRGDPGTPTTASRPYRIFSLDHKPVGVMLIL